MAKVVALDAPTGAGIKRLGFMKGRMTVPEDFDKMGAAKIAKLFAGDN